MQVQTVKCCGKCPYSRPLDGDRLVCQDSGEVVKAHWKPTIDCPNPEDNRFHLELIDRVIRLNDGAMEGLLNQVVTQLHKANLIGTDDVDNLFDDLLIQCEKTVWEFLKTPVG